MRKIGFLPFGLLLSAGIAAQPNVIPGVDVKTSNAIQFGQHGRSGTFPNGIAATALETQSCNVGTVPVSWYAPMNADHPVIALSVFRLSDGIFEQISHNTHVKHGFLSINASRCGFSCRIPPQGGNQLGLGCSDTYGSSLNASRYYLGPVEEIDPWTGIWEPIGSYFDRGDPDVGPPRNSDGVRSLTRQQADAMPQTKNRMTVADADFNVANARFFYSAYYVVLGEAEAVRTNNLRHVETTPTWSGTRWNFSDASAQDKGSVMKRWPDATRSSSANGSDDGRFYLGVHVRGPDANGMYRYVYAVHNRDNSRGAAALRIPVCPDATTTNFYIHDADRNPANDWTSQRTSTELAFLAGQDNALEWNNIYTFVFESNAAPTDGQIVLDQARPGPGSSTITLNARVPGTNLITGPGCGVPSAPVLATSGSPDRASIPNPSFGLVLSGLGSGNTAAINVSLTSGNTDLGGGCALLIDAANAVFVTAGTASASGELSTPFPVPNNSSLEGASVHLQGFEAQAGGAYLNAFDLSNGLQVVIGNNCP